MCGFLCLAFSFRMMFSKFIYLIAHISTFIIINKCGKYTTFNFSIKLMDIRELPLFGSYELVLV